MLELLRYLAASKRPAAPHMIMGHAGAVAAVQLKKAQILGLRLEVPVSNRHVSSLAHSPTAKEVGVDASARRTEPRRDSLRSVKRYAWCE